VTVGLAVGDRITAIFVEVHPVIDVTIGLAGADGVVANKKSNSSPVIVRFSVRDRIVATLEVYPESPVIGCGAIGDNGVVASDVNPREATVDCFDVRDRHV